MSTKSSPFENKTQELRTQDDLNFVNLTQRALPKSLLTVNDGSEVAKQIRELERIYITQLKEELIEEQKNIQINDSNEKISEAARLRQLQLQQKVQNARLNLSKIPDRLQNFQNFQAEQIEFRKQLQIKNSQKVEQFLAQKQQETAQIQQQMYSDELQRDQYLQTLRNLNELKLESKYQKLGQKLNLQSQLINQQEELRAQQINSIVQQVEQKQQLAQKNREQLQTEEETRKSETINNSETLKNRWSENRSIHLQRIQEQMRNKINQIPNKNLTAVLQIQSETEELKNRIQAQREQNENNLNNFKNQRENETAQLSQFRNLKIQRASQYLQYTDQLRQEKGMKITQKMDTLRSKSATQNKILSEQEFKEHQIKLKMMNVIATTQNIPEEIKQFIPEKSILNKNKAEAVQMIIQNEAERQKVAEVVRKTSRCYSAGIKQIKQLVQITKKELTQTQEPTVQLKTKEHKAKKEAMEKTNVYKVPQHFVVNSDGKPKTKVNQVKLQEIRDAHNQKVLQLMQLNRQREMQRQQALNKVMSQEAALKLEKLFEEERIAYQQSLDRLRKQLEQQECECYE
ncbi:Conserved_hypothetical protein [Hexamita inflata]|uniref:Uncharacterized protein n=1 Tax=Hexamita inflata TaxID=28002 RepID=A0ABP1J4Y0_9EUKA